MTFADDVQRVVNGRGREPEGARVRRLFALAWEQRMADAPEWATQVGHAGFDDRWTDWSPAGIAARRAVPEILADALASIDPAQLGERDAFDYDLFARDTVRALDGRRFPAELLPLNQMEGVHQLVPFVLDLMPATTDAQCEAVLARLDGVPRLVDETLALLAEGLARGVTPARVALRDVPQQVRNLLRIEGDASPLLAPFAKPGALADDRGERWRAQARDAVAGAVRPAFERLQTYLADVYVPEARETIALSALPDGEAWYAFNARSSTTTALTPRAIHEIGLAEVARIRAAMDAVRAQVGFTGSFDDFSTFLRTDPRFFHTSAEALLAGYRDICKRADPELPRLFGTLPRLPYGVRAVPAHAERSQTTAYYEQGAPSAGRPGWYYANTYDLPSRPTWEMEALSLHEAVPGHHLQIALAEEMPDTPEFRRHARYTAYIEGWGLYAEHLGTEMGFYTDPYARYGQLTYEMWRAVRLVVDTGMHALGWTRAQAIDFFRSNCSKSEHDIVVEIDRYIVWPGQALAYKIGELEIRRLRREAEEQLGAAFDMRAFHDVVLGRGAVPLDVLAAMVAAWTASVRR